MKSRVWWWLAINGPTCTASPMAYRDGGFEIWPIPQILVGFRSQKEQLKICHFMLNAPLDEVHEFMNSLHEKETNGKVCIVFEEHPDEPNPNTIWTPTK